METLLTVPEAASLMRIGKSTLRRYLRRRLLAHVILPGGELQAVHPDAQKGFIAPDMASLSIDPFSPGTLGDEEPREVVGFVALSFAGNGYFSWRDDPFGSYWREVRNGETLQRAQEVCRNILTVPRLSFFDEMVTDLGPLFLNRDEYKQGDWVVTISETG